MLSKSDSPTGFVSIIRRISIDQKMILSVNFSFCVSTSLRKRYTRTASTVLPDRKMPAVLETQRGVGDKRGANITAVSVVVRAPNMFTFIYNHASQRNTHRYFVVGRANETDFGRSTGREIKITKTRTTAFRSVQQPLAFLFIFSIDIGNQSVLSVCSSRRK